MLIDCLFQTASQDPQKIALRCGGQDLNYGDFRGRILAAAARLRALGIGPGDRVILSGLNSLPVPILYFAIHALGAIAVPVAPDSPEIVLACLAENCEARLALVDGAMVKRTLSICCPVASPTQIAAPGEESVDPVCAGDDVADILYTTGTTGAKKGVVLTQANILAAARNMTAFIGTTADDVELVPLPLSHSFGLGRLRCLALVGHTIILEPGVGSGAPIIKRLRESRPTALALVPAGFEILRQVTGDALGMARSHLRHIEIGSAPMRPQTREWLMEMLPDTRICHHYGLTEASRAGFTEYHADRYKPGTAGKAAPNVTITICNRALQSQAWQPAAPGESGEVVVKGGMVMREYWRRPDLTSQAMCAYGVRTGDLGYMDADGYLFLQGRQNDVINVGGRKVIPDEVEEAIRQFEGVRDAACVGEADPLSGERVKVFVVADGPMDLPSLTIFLRTRIEEYKIPRALEMVAALPRTTSGKLQRNLLRQAPPTLEEATLGS